MKKYDKVYIRPDLIDGPEDEEGRIQGTRVVNGNEQFWVSNLNMPYMGTISAWFTANEISLEPWK